MCYNSGTHFLESFHGPPRYIGAMFFKLVESKHSQYLKMQPNGDLIRMELVLPSSLWDKKDGNTCENSLSLLCRPRCKRSRQASPKRDPVQGDWIESPDPLILAGFLQPGMDWHHFLDQGLQRLCPTARWESPG